MNIHYYTSISFSYLSRAMVLQQSVKKHHPDWISWLFISDRLPDDSTLDFSRTGFDHVVFINEISDVFDLSFIFKHNVVELCTAVKGAAMQKLMASDAKSVIYLDPDVVLFKPLDVVLDKLRDSSIVLTPHVTQPERERLAIMDNEIGSLKHGVFNLGFIAVKNDDEGRRFAQWWSDRLILMCYEEPWQGVYTDQKWCDLVPCFFDHVAIMRHSGLNVASWNINNKKIFFSQDGDIRVNNVDLLFYHFTKIEGPGLAMTDRYVNDNFAVYELIKWYRSQIERNKILALPNKYWAFGNFSDGSEITLEARQRYRERLDLQKAFPDPFVCGPKSFKQWFAAHGKEG